VQLRELAEGLQVFPDAMRRNLDLSGPLLLSEAVTAAVAPLLAGLAAGQAVADGKQRLQSVVDQTLRVPLQDQAATYRRLLRAAVPTDLLSDARLEELLDPSRYLGQAAEISRRILAAYPEYSAGAEGGGLTGPAISAPTPTPELNGASHG
jgi:3-carboxy-cis,cis-muconate cycloisomerase